MNVDISKYVLQLLPDAYLMVGSKGKIISSNEAAGALFGYKEEEFDGMAIEELIPHRYRKNHDSHRASYAKKPERKLMSRREELSGLRKDGTEFPVEITLGPLEILGDTYVIAIVRDLSERKFMDVLKEKNKELEQFTYVASHDLQEPLRTVMSFVEQLKKELPEDNATAQTYMRFIQQASERMSGLIKGLLDYSRIGRNRELESINTEVMLKNIQADLQTRIADQNATIIVESLPEIRGYATELRLLFQNLITNSLKFVAPGTYPRIVVSGEELKNAWKFSIQDNGIGIKDEHKEKVFQIFQRLNSNSKYEGSGIGLAHCYKIAQLHQGEIWVDSVFGEGSTFYFTIQKP